MSNVYMTKIDKKLLSNHGFTKVESRGSLKYYKIVGNHKIIASIEVNDGQPMFRAYDMNLESNRIGIKNAFLTSGELKLFYKKLKELM